MRQLESWAQRAHARRCLDSDSCHEVILKANMTHNRLCKTGGPNLEWKAVGVLEGRSRLCHHVCDSVPPPGVVSCLFVGSGGVRVAVNLAPADQNNSDCWYASAARAAPGGEPRASHCNARSRTSTRTNLVGSSRLCSTSKRATPGSWQGFVRPRSVDASAIVLQDYSKRS